MSRQAALFHARERRRAADRFDQFAALIDSPHDIASSAVELPAAGFIGVSADVSVTAGDISIATTLASRTLETPDLDADIVYFLGQFEKGETLDVTFSGGDISLWIVNDWNELRSIFAQGTFA